MDDMKCDIIQDLLPLYIDNVCSEESKAYVEAHLASCEKCRNIERTYRENAFMSEKVEIKQLDGLKKIKSKVKMQSLFSYAIVLFLAAIGIYTFINNVNEFPKWFVYVIFAVCMLSTAILTVSGSTLLGDFSAGDLSKKNIIPGVLSIAAIIYEIFIICYCINSIEMGKMPFGLAEYSIGPFLKYQMIVIFVIHLAAFAWTLGRTMRKHADCRFWLCINLTGIFLLVIHMSLLGELSSFEYFKHNLLVETLAVIFIGIIGAVINVISAKKRYL
ncbi:MAG: zf-HC2 domain-containing protein [Roseburia sp.]|nr:zf-HC2 domain-containing protein [Roseburia sp.]